MDTIGLNRILLEILYALRNLNDAVVQRWGAVEPDEWLFEQEVMEILKIRSRKTIYNWRTKDLLPHKILGRTPYYLKSGVLKMLDKQTRLQAGEQNKS